MQRNIRQSLQTGVNGQLAGLVVKRCGYFPLLENFFYELKRLVQRTVAEGARAMISAYPQAQSEDVVRLPLQFLAGQNRPKIFLHRRQHDEDRHQACRFCQAAHNMTDLIPSQPSMLRLVLQPCETKVPRKTLH